MTCIDVILLVLPRLSGEAGGDSGFLLCISDALTAHPDIFKWQFCTVDYFGGPPALPSHNTSPGPFICTSSALLEMGALLPPSHSKAAARDQDVCRKWRSAPE